MKRFFVLVCLLFSGKSAWTQITPNVWADYSVSKPKGRVVMMTYKDYSETYSFGEVSELKRGQSEIVAYFNKNGRVCYERLIDDAKRTEVSYLYEGGKLIKRIAMRPKATESGVLYDTIGVTTYTYDGSGRMKTRSYWKNNKLTGKDRFEYTSAGYTSYRYDGTGTLDRTFERKGNMLSSSVKEGTKYEYILDDEDRTIQLTILLGATNGFGRITAYCCYNQYGDEMYSYSTVGSSLRTGKDAIVYNRLPNGNVVATIDDEYSNELHTKKGSTFKYEYDAKNNWIVKSDVAKQTRVVREIVYAKSDNDFAIVEHEIERSRQTLDSVLYENHVLEIQRQKKAAREAEEAAKAREAEEDKRQKLALAAETRKKAAFTAARRKIIEQDDKKERMGAFRSSYPYICKAVSCLRDELELSDISGNSAELECVFHPIDVYAIRLKCYINSQRILTGLLNDKNKKKNAKTLLERSLKKAGNDAQRVAMLEEWLRNRGGRLVTMPTDTDSQKTNLLNSYSGYDEKLKMNKESVIADVGRDYIVWRLGGRFLKDPYGERSETNPINISVVHLNKCIEVQKFVGRLLEDAEQRKELEGILKHIKQKYSEPKYTDGTIHDTHHSMLFWAFEDYLQKHGIAIPQTYEAAQKAVETNSTEL